MKRMIVGFSKAVCFVYGTKLPAWNRHNDEEQERKDDGHHHIHILAEQVWTDIYELIAFVDCAFLGSMHCHVVFKDSGPYRDPTRFFRSRQNLAAEK